MTKHNNPNIKKFKNCFIWNMDSQDPKCSQIQQIKLAIIIISVTISLHVEPRPDPDHSREMGLSFSRSTTCRKNHQDLVHCGLGEQSKAAFLVPQSPADETGSRGLKGARDCGVIPTSWPQVNTQHWFLNQRPQGGLDSCLWMCT